MAKRKTSTAQQYRSQQAQIIRIQKMIDDMRQSGFEFNRQFLDSLHVSGKTPSAAKAKAERLRGISKSDLYKKVTSYRTDSGKLITGQGGKRGLSAGERGRIIEQRKARAAKKQALSGLDNVEDSLSNLNDSFYYGSERTDMSPSKSAILAAWQSFRDGIRQRGMITQEEKAVLSEIVKICAILAEEYLSSKEAYQYYERIFSLLTNGASLSLTNVVLYESSEGDLED